VLEKTTARWRDLAHSMVMDPGGWKLLFASVLGDNKVSSNRVSLGIKSLVPIPK